MKTFVNLRLVREEGLGLDCSLEQARSLISELPEEYDELVGMLDEAQGAVHSGARAVSYVVLRIK